MGWSKGKFRVDMEKCQVDKGERQIGKEKCQAGKENLRGSCRLGYEPESA